MTTREIMERSKEIAWQVGEPNSNTGRLLKLSLISDLSGTHIEPWLASLAGVATKFETTFAATKDDLPLLSGCRYGDVRSKDGSLRHNGNVISVAAIILDVDRCELSPATIAEMFRRAGVAALVVTTPSHLQPGKGNRMRVILPLSMELPAADHERLVARANGIIGGRAAGESYTLSQSFYNGRVANVPFESFLIEGGFLDELNELDPGAFEKLKASLPVPSSNVDVGTLRPALMAIPNGEKGQFNERSDWLAMMAGVHHATGGSSDGLDLFLEWSAQWPGDDPEYTEKTWRTLRLGREGQRQVTAGTIFAMAKTYNWTWPRLDPDKEFLDEDVAGANLEEEPRTAKETGWLASMNERHALAVINGKTLVINIGGRAITYSSISDLKTFYANQQIKIGNKIASIAEHWHKHQRRRSYKNGVIFAPGSNVDGAYNLFDGWGVLPKAGSCDLILQHFLQYICTGEQKHYDCLLDFLAHMVQKPQEKPNYAIVLCGEKGTGKDTVGEYLYPFLKRNRAKIGGQMKHLTSSFNALLENALLVHVEEGMWGGNREAESALKSLITASTVRIERKGIDTFEVDSFCRILMTANADWAVPATPGERRFFVLDVSDHWSIRNKSEGERKAYFDSIYAERDTGGAEALLHLLMERDITGFNPRQAPETRGLMRQKIHSLGGVDRWYFDLLQRGELPVDDGQSGRPDWSSHSMIIKLEHLHAFYETEVSPKRREWGTVPLNVFGGKLLEMCPELVAKTVRIGGKPVRRHVFPPLAVCRKAMEAFLGGQIKWADDPGNILHPDVRDLV